jgi:hypothetical protein
MTVKLRIKDNRNHQSKKLRPASRSRENWIIENWPIKEYSTHSGQESDGTYYYETPCGIKWSENWADSSNFSDIEGCEHIDCAIAVAKTSFWTKEPSQEKKELIEYSEKGTINGIEAEQVFHHIDMKIVNGRYATAPNVKGSYHKDGYYGNMNGKEEEKNWTAFFIFIMVILLLIIAFFFSHP